MMTVSKLLHYFVSRCFTGLYGIALEFDIIQKRRKRREGQKAFLEYATYLACELLL
jgi:hypothetical protein